MEEWWASFGEHIDDLRQTLVRSCLIIGVAFLVILGFYQPIFQFLLIDPLEQTESGLIQHKVQRTKVTNQTTRVQIFELPPHSHVISNFLLEEPPIESRQYHLAPGETLFYEQVLQSPLLILGPIEGLVLVFKVCFWLSVVLTAPLWGWAWLQFILPGLKREERSLVLPFLFCSIFCLCLGIAFAYYVTLPLANQYLLAFNQSLGQNAWTFTNYANYVLLLCFGHAIAGELSLLLLMLVHFRFLSADWLRAKRRYFIVLAFILGGLLTPPDVFTQLLLALPLMGLYEVAIWYAKWRQRVDFNVAKSKQNSSCDA